MEDIKINSSFLSVATSESHSHVGGGRKKAVSWSVRIATVAPNPPTLSSSDVDYSHISAQDSHLSTQITINPLREEIRDEKRQENQQNGNLHSQINHPQKHTDIQHSSDYTLQSQPSHNYGQTITKERHDFPLFNHGPPIRMDSKIGYEGRASAIPPPLITFNQFNDSTASLASAVIDPLTPSSSHLHHTHQHKAHQGGIRLTSNNNQHPRESAGALNAIRHDTGFKKENRSLPDFLQPDVTIETEASKTRRSTLTSLDVPDTKRKSKQTPDSQIIPEQCKALPPKEIGFLIEFSSGLAQDFHTLVQKILPFSDSLLCVGRVENSDKKALSSTPTLSVSSKVETKDDLQSEPLDGDLKTTKTSRQPPHFIPAGVFPLRNFMKQGHIAFDELSSCAESDLTIYHPYFPSYRKEWEFNIDGRSLAWEMLIYKSSPLLSESSSLTDGNTTLGVELLKLAKSPISPAMPSSPARISQPPSPMFPHSITQDIPPNFSWELSTLESNHTPPLTTSAIELSSITLPLDRTSAKQPSLVQEKVLKRENTLEKKPRPSSAGLNARPSSAPLQRRVDDTANFSQSSSTIHSERDLRSPIPSTSSTADSLRNAGSKSSRQANNHRPMSAQQVIPRPASCGPDTNFRDSTSYRIRNPLAFLRFDDVRSVPFQPTAAPSSPQANGGMNLGPLRGWGISGERPSSAMGKPRIDGRKQRS